MVQLPIVAEANTRDEWVKTPVGDYSIKGAGYILYGEALKNNRGQ